MPKSEKLTASTTNRKISWQQLSLAQPLDLGRHNEIVVEQECVPIIVVPGIMGTRLRNTSGMVWDPDDLAHTIMQYGVRPNGPRTKQKLLIGHRFYDRLNLRIAELDPLIAEHRGWPNLVQSAYRNLYETLVSENLSPATRLCFETPIYAFGYNWTMNPAETGALLAEFVRSVIAHHARLQPCRYVMVVTHSMGGLVARSAAHLHGAASSILGMVHVAQPAAGAPVAYGRMKTGFELQTTQFGSAYAKQWGASWALGRNGREVTATLGNMPGGLALLPTHRYRDAQGNGGWLRPEASTTGTQGPDLPQYGDPYAEIYRNPDHAWRLIDADLLKPGHKGTPETWQAYLQNLAGVEQFHRALGDRHHPNTTHIVCDGLSTMECLDVRVRKRSALEADTGAPGKAHTLQLYDESLKHMDMFYQTRQFKAQPATRGSTAEHPSLPSFHVPGILGAVNRARLKGDAWQLRLDLQPIMRPDGDGTVPVSSCLASDPNPDDVILVPGVEHGQAMADPQVRRHIVRALQKLGHGLIAREAARGSAT